MIDHGDLPLRPALAAAIAETWRELGRPGARWTGAERIDIARATRAATGGSEPAATTLPSAAIGAAHLLATEPAATTEAWVADVVAAIGEAAYVELVGVVARVVAVDTFRRLLGLDEVPLPEPVPGAPTDEPVPEGARRNRTWVRMLTPSAPLVLGAVPSTEAAVNALCDELYLPPARIGEPDFGRGLLDRPGIELVAATVSHENECFY